MIKKIITFLTILTLTISARFSPDLPDEVLETAKQALVPGNSAFAIDVESKAKWLMGENDFTLSELKPGIPVPVYRVDIEKMKSSPDNVPLKDIIYHDGCWRVFIYKDKKCVAFLDVKFFDGKWRVITHAGAVPGKAWDRITAKWDKKDIIIVQCRGEWFHVKSMNDNNLTELVPKNADSIGLNKTSGSEYENLTPGSETISKLKGKFEINLND